MVISDMWRRRVRACEGIFCLCGDTPALPCSALPPTNETAAPECSPRVRASRLRDDRGLRRCAALRSGTRPPVHPPPSANRMPMRRAAYAVLRAPSYRASRITARVPWR